MNERISVYADGPLIVFEDAIDGKTKVPVMANPHWQQADDGASISVFVPGMSGFVFKVESAARSKASIDTLEELITKAYMEAYAYAYRRGL
tara:strand:- start:277 stop:549 length:273 start_codon:yes stop_codon:yes gene_type:complete